MCFYTQNGWKPIHYACGRRLLEMARALIKLGSSPTATTDNEVAYVAPSLLINYRSHHYSRSGSRYTLHVEQGTRNSFVISLTTME